MCVKNHCLLAGFDTFNIGYHVLQAHDTAKAALDQAKQLQQAAQASLQQPCFLQQPYWCDGATMTAKDLEDWQKAGLPFRAVVLLKAPQESTPAQDTPPLLAGMPSCVISNTWHMMASSLCISLLLPDLSAAICCHLCCLANISINTS